MKLYFLMFFSAFGLFCNGQGALPNKNPFVVVLGTLQDGGSPHMGCEKECCKNPDASRKVVSLGLIDPVSNKKIMLEASPDFVAQTRMLKALLPSSANKLPDGIFLTHAHIGHYAGLMFLGKEMVRFIMRLSRQLNNFKRMKML
jgi:phosphoribosyl 1,2-cyclic phosphodiesterase